VPAGFTPHGRQQVTSEWLQTAPSPRNSFPSHITDIYRITRIITHSISRDFDFRRLILRPGKRKQTLTRADMHKPSRHADCGSQLQAGGNRPGDGTPGHRSGRGVHDACPPSRHLGSPADGGRDRRRRLRFAARTARRVVRTDPRILPRYQRLRARLLRKRHAVCRSICNRAIKPRKARVFLPDREYVT